MGGQRIGLIDVDGHNFPNLALMRISAWHKQQGDQVEWWWSDLIHYEKVYKSKIYSSAYSVDVPDPLNADEVIKGGTGYCIYIGDDGREHFDQSKNKNLPNEVEKMFPDYSIYPQFKFAVSMTSRGCPRGCAFCHVKDKEGQCAVKVADVSDFWCGQDEIRMRSEYNLFGDEEEATRYHVLSWAIKEMNAEPVRHGHWKWMGETGDSRYMCSVCKSKEDVPTCNGEPTVWEYCPNCGAKMDEEGEDE